MTDDEAFNAGIGVDVATFQAGWLADLGAKTPTTVGPVAGPAGPLPPGWAQDPNAPSGPLPPVTGPTSRPGSPSVPAIEGQDEAATLFVVVLTVGILALFVGLVVRARRARPEAPS